MKTKLLIMALIFVIPLTIAIPVHALPWIDFGSTFIWDDGNKILTNDGPSTYVNSVTYMDGTTAIPFPWPPADGVLGSSVSLNLSFDGDNTNDFLTVTGMGTTWLDADLEIMGAMPDPLSASPNPYKVKIESSGLVVGTGLGSRAIDEFFSRLDMTNLYPAELSFAWIGNSPLGGNIYKINAAGKVNPVPEPGTMMLLGSGLAGIAVYARRRRK